MESNSRLVRVTTADLRKVLASLKSERDSLSKVYSSEVKGVLESSQQCFQVAGLDYSSITGAIDNTFKTLNTNLTSLIDVLENDVIKNYDELLDALRQKFGAQFASQMQSLLGLR